MFSDPLALLSPSFLILEGVCYLAAVVQALRWRVGRGNAAPLLGLYALGGFALTLAEFLQAAGRLPFAGSDALTRLQIYGTLALSLLTVYVARAFFRMRKRVGLLWLGIGVFLALTLVLLDSGLLPLPEVLWTNGTHTLLANRLGIGVAVGGWALFMAAAILTVWYAMRRIRQPLHRNRASYWLPIFLFLALNDALLFLSGRSWSGFFRLLAVLLLAYVLTRHRLPDMRQILRRFFAFLTAVALLLLAYLAFVYLGTLAVQLGVSDNGLLVGGALVLMLAAVFIPLYTLLRAVIHRLLPLGQYNPSRTLRDYSASISNILEMERLAAVAVGLIVEAMDLRHGALFLVDRERNADGQPCFRLRPVRAAGESSLPSGTLSQSSPVALALSRDRHPLLQYDIDLMPAYQQTPVAERRWLARLEAEVYVPIFSKEEWIGMLALGAKTSGTRYSEDDLNVLVTIANQTAVALENARLVENLVRLNREIRQAYQALDNAARELERLDRTKSDFISIASHELRTPLTVLRGYSEMLLEDPAIKQNPSHYQIIAGIHKGTLRLHEIMDSMFDIAAIERNAIELHMQNLDLTDLVQEVCRSLEKPIHDRKQTLTIDLPSLPSIKADPNTLKKVFFHLIINAIKFTPNGGQIMISGRHLNPNQRDLPEGGVEIIVADTGVGVDPEYRETIFTKFYQPEDELNKHSTGKTKFKGSGAGLGLALSKGIVEAHGGRIWVESPGHDEVKCPGSQFHVVLPLRRQGESETVRMGSAMKMKL